jgi:hypothetical protein
MKFKSLIISTLLGCQMAFAQDSIRIETTQATDFTPPQYASTFDDVFLNRRTTKWLLKADLMPLLRNEYGAGESGLGIEFERKLGSVFSINTGVFINDQVFETAGMYRPLSLIVEPRWFFNAKQKMAIGKSANNLNGHYISLRTNLSKHVGSENVLGTLDYLNEKNISLNYGMQKRVFNNWYINYRAGLGYTQRQSPKNTNWTWADTEQFGLETQFTFGVAFGCGKKSKYEVCDLFRCFEEEKSLLKLDVRGIVEALRKNTILSQAIVGYEQKLKNPSWSLNSEFRYYYFDSKSDNSTTNSFSQRNVQLRGVLEPRFYYNMKKRIAKGKSANNLSGNYVSLAVVYNIEKDRYTNNNSQFPEFNSLQTYDSRYLTFAPKFGLQRRVFKHGFVDISAAPLQLSYGQFSNRPTEWFSGFDGLPIVDAKIGFAF